MLIVGGGPTGLFLAGLLAGHGATAVVVEQRTRLSAHSRAIGLHPPGLAALQLLGLDEPALAQGVQVTSGVCRSRGRELGRVTFEQAWPDTPFVLTLPQHTTETLLAHRLEELAPGSVQRGEELLEVHEDGESVRATTRRPGPADGPGKGHGVITSWRARVLVGADGAHSRVRAGAGIAVDTTVYPDAYLMGDVADTSSASSTAVIHLEPDGVVESFPLPGGVRRFVAHTGSHLVDRPRPDVLSDLIARRTGDVVDPRSSTMISAFGVRRQLVRRMVTRRQVLIGDAAHVLSPIGGQGMTLGWLDAVALAPLLADLLARSEGRPLHTLHHFQDFERVRRRAARRAAHQAELNMVLGRPVPLRTAGARDALVRAVLGTPARHRLASAFTMQWASAGLVAPTGTTPPRAPTPRSPGRQASRPPVPVPGGPEE